MRLEVNPGKAHERFARRFYAGDVFPQIELSHFVAFAASGVRHVDSYCNVAMASGSGRRRNQMIVTDGGVAEAESKRKQRLAIIVYILQSS